MATIGPAARENAHLRQAPLSKEAYHTAGLIVRARLAGSPLGPGWIRRDGTNVHKKDSGTDGHVRE